MAASAKVFLLSRYGILAIIGIVTLSMTGIIFVLPMYDTKTPTSPAVANNFRTFVPTITPVLSSPPKEESSVSAATNGSGNMVLSKSASTATPFPSPTPTIDMTAGWPSYTNSQWGYSIKYPPGWVIQNISPLEPKVPSYIIFNDKTASPSSRSITISVSNRTYVEQLAIGGAGSSILIAGIRGTQEYLKDSNGNQSVTIILPRASDLILLHAKLIYATFFNEMLQTFKLLN